MDAARWLRAPRPGLAVLTIGVALAAGLATPWFLDYDEAVYADVAHGMATSGDWFRPESNCEPFYEKPIVFYWLVALLYKMVGLTPVAPRLVSALALLIGLAYLAREVGRWATPVAAEIAVWIAGASLLPFSLGRIGLFDALLCCTMTVALLAFLRGLGAEASHRRWALALGYGMTGAALAVKGPVFPLVIAGVLLLDALVQRDVRGTLRRSGIVWGALLVLAVGLPPYVLTARAAGQEFIAVFLGRHNLGRALAPMHGHDGPALYYLAVLAAGMLPFSALLPPAFVRLRRLEPGVRRLASFAAAWGLLVIVGFSLVATKLPHYIAPAVAPLAIVAALWLSARAGGGRAAWHATLALGSGVALLLAMLPSLLERLPDLLGRSILDRLPGSADLAHGVRPGLGFVLAGVCLAGGAVRAWLLARRDLALRAVRALGRGGVLAWVTLLISIGSLADARFIMPLRRLALAATHDLAPGKPIHVVELNRRLTPNLATGRCTVFLRARTSAERERLREILADDGGVRMIVGDARWDTLGAEIGGREIARDGAYVLVGGR